MGDTPPPLPPAVVEAVARAVARAIVAAVRREDAARRPAEETTQPHDDVAEREPPPAVNATA